MHPFLQNNLIVDQVNLVNPLVRFKKDGNLLKSICNQYIFNFMNKTCFNKLNYNYISLDR